MALIINGEHIDDEIIEAEFREIKGYHERTLQVSCCERDPEFRGMAKDNISSRVLLNQEGKRRYPVISEAETDERLAKLIEEAGGEVEFFLKIGLPVKDKEMIRENLAGGVRLGLLLHEKSHPEPQPDEKMLIEAYEKGIQHYMTEEQIRAAHVTKSLQGAKSRSEVYEVMRKVREQLLEGADFMAVAEEHRAAAEQQIDLGWFKRGEFMEEFETIAFSLRIGEISPVFVTQLGFHVCTVLDRRPSVPLPFEEVRELVARRVLETHRDQKFNELVDGLKAAASIEDTDPEPEEGSSGHAEH
jgi:parvulin-like peptidyl-prolyl isomerase